MSQLLSLELWRHIIQLSLSRHHGRTLGIILIFHLFLQDIQFIDHWKRLTLSLSLLFLQSIDFQSVEQLVR